MHQAHRPGILLLVLALSASLLVPCASAQARKTAERSAELDAFGGFTYLNNDYYAPYDNFGVTLGVDYTHFIKRFHGLIIPSLQLRGTITPGESVSEKTIGGGLKLATTYHRFHPYGDFEMGLGVINFPLPPNPVPGTLYRIRDSSAIYIYGGGITYDIKPAWSLMLDYQRQHWDLGAAPPAPPDRLNPQALTLGVVFRVPFKAYKIR